MFKRTKGYLLLTMLVLTGLAGKIHSDTISGKERRTLTRELKASRTALMESIENLSARQLNFKPSKGQLSIKESVYQLTSIEYNLWSTAKKVLQQEALKGNKSFCDEDLNTLISTTTPVIPVKKEKFKSIKDAIKIYKNDRLEMLKYINTSTANMRAYRIRTECGTLDPYQLLLLDGMYTRHFTKLINEIRSDPNFPK